MANQVDVWVSRIIGGLIAVCVLIVFCAVLVAAIVGLLGIFAIEGGVGYVRRWFG